MNPPTPEREVVHYSEGAPGCQNVATYDELRYLGPANEYKFRVMAATYNHLLGPLTGKNVVDVGCGTGRGLAGFALTAVSVTGVDASPEMLIAAERKVSNLGNCRFILAHAQSIPLPSESFDVVTSLNFLHLFSEETQTQMVAEMKRLLRPGGIMLLEFDNGLQAVLLGTLKRWMKREAGAMYPWEISRIIGSDVKVTAISGAVVPIAWRLMYRIPRISEQMEKLSWFPPLNRFMHRVYYRLTK